MLFEKIRLVFIITCLGTGLIACSDNDTGTSDKSGPTAQSAVSTESAGASTGAVNAYDPDVPSMIVEDNGVIHQDEIYRNWPE